ncbi:uncharacterized protein MELLADRAFT_89789 [Melampsora larici-populina 98AG31]|uniref:Helicase C-terminal domain-containing protein n=1 Tax=Melampsora larici-populina (strain 98AG31 / pathotype 3-4-7) TaxID=747676 RepID=F4RHG3_MELLP|nr:uncharacterized protein MELLADRAFT_84940 [Melampsora larici-populina 98AG31]XP_007411549.1 uncharacterized protein MELLADRAFT_88297 [Melampsora larici-populina 98AG31]XP_007412143.1 uncharacterized protein MELLADRAFT_88629 [Melampsora larici-populina 98AG31]XP_007412757.1 uncharacterized protein MELLADRAFT_89789 [Melampsora larici-populina 98AG31]EGG03964.1 hypothetical protein MELLADRAFT_89789 [Melampsora larici-populina 98AG31]EGG04704.1 hypothetical protein MELLADRAFT_88629 [Melampsora l
MEEELGIMVPDGRALTADARPAYLEDWSLSSKLAYLVSQLKKKHRTLHKGLCKKTVIYTQWRCFMEWIKIALDCHGIGSGTLHGDMTTHERTCQLNRFKNDNNIEAFIVSIEAGGVGLNMTCADEVYLMDAHWNPQIVQQAIDRLHRIGQTHPVKVYHVVAGQSVEQHLFNVSQVISFQKGLHSPSSAKTFYTPQVQKKKASLARKIITLSVPKDQLKDYLQPGDTMDVMDDIGNVNACYAEYV